jgi:hypothetical protein
MQGAVQVSELVALFDLLLVPASRGTCPLSVHRQDKAWGLANYFLGDAPHQQSIQSCPPVRPHNDQVALGFPGCLQNRGRWISFDQQVINSNFRVDQLNTR